jgi:hypothetical protein
MDTIINKIKKYNNNKLKEISEIFNFKDKYIIDLNNKLLTLYDNNNNKKLVSEYIFYGIYQPHTKLWIWANSIPGVNKQNINIVETIKRNNNYIFENDDSDEGQYIYQFLTQDIIIINNKNILDLITMTLNYISNSLNILSPENEYGNYQFIGITNIIEKYS